MLHHGIGCQLRMIAHQLLVNQRLLLRSSTSDPESTAGNCYYGYTRTLEPRNNHRSLGALGAVETCERMLQWLAAHSDNAGG